MAQADALQEAILLMANSTILNKNIAKAEAKAKTKAKVLTKEDHYAAAFSTLPFTEAAYEDELLYRLSSFNSCYIIEDLDGVTHIQINWLYQEQAEANLYYCGIYEHPPEFVIFTEDMPTWLMDAIAHLDELTKKRIVTNAVRRLYEAADPEYFHTNGISGKIKWGFVSEK